MESWASNYAFSYVENKAEYILLLYNKWLQNAAKNGGSLIANLNVSSYNIEHLK